MRECPGSHNVKRPRGSTVLRVLLASIVLASVGLVIQTGTPFGDSPVLAAAATDCTSTLPTLDDGKYRIDTPGKLFYVAEKVSTTSATFADKSLLQTADLDLTHCGDWPGIGLYYFTGSDDDYYPGPAFTGIYDGNGHSISNLKISRSFSDTGALYYGVGLFGWIDGAEIRNVKLTNSTVSAELQGGGLIGLAQGSTVSGSSFSGEISGNSDIGGLIGKAVNTTVSVSAFNGSVVAQNGFRVGGLIGGSEGSTVEGSSAAGSVTTNSSYQGGLIGEAESTVITNSFASVTVTGYSETGGLVGRAINSTISKSFASGAVTGTVTGNDLIGGLIGVAGSSSVSDSYATGAVTADGTRGNNVGGLIGVGSALTLTNTFAAGQVIGFNGEGGGLIGKTQFSSDGSSTVTGSFWDVTATGQNGTSMGEPAGGFGKTTAQMKSFSPFRGAGWKITANDTPRVWGLCDDGSSYPFLMWQTTLGVGAPGSVACTVGTGDLGLAGEGTEASPYEISTYADLLLLSGESSIWNKYFVQTAHITVTDSTMTPIGSNAPKFTGVYDGQGFEVRDLVINTSSLDQIGLFGFTNNAVIRNVRIIDAELNGRDEVGGLIGRADNTVVENSSTAGNVTGRGEAGGLIGKAQNGSLSGSFSSSSVTLSGYYGGGLVGLSVGLTVTDSYANGPIVGGYYVGGLAGYFQEGSMSSSYAVGAVRGDNYLGGLIGDSWETTVTSSFWDLDTSGQTASSGGTGRATVAMKTLATYESLWSIANGYDDTKTWGICAAEGLDGYPFLTWQFSEAPCEASDVSDDDSNDDSQENPTDENGTGGEGESSSFTPSPTLPGDRQSDSAATPLLVDGALPQMALGEVMVYEDGVPVTVQIFVDDDTELVIEASTFELRLSGECETGCTVEETDAGQLVLTLEQDGAARTDGVGFEPGSKVDVWLFSEPRYLGQLTVSADGTFSGTLPLGDIEVGAHTLQVNGLSAQGVQRSANIGVVVNALEIPTVGTLPTTGARSDLAPWLILLISIGGILLLVSRRPRFNQNCLR
jgi:hypothetical protein